MGIRTTVNSNGIVETSSTTSGLVVGNMSDNAGVLPFKCPVNDTSSVLSGAFTLSQAGFYFVSGSNTCTGTLPTASQFPMAMIGFALVGTNTALLTGTRVPPATAIFCKDGTGIGSVSASVVGGGTAAGDTLTIPTSGSVTLISDGRFWIPMASSGSLTIALDYRISDYSLYVRFSADNSGVPAMSVREPLRNYGIRMFSMPEDLLSW